VLGHGRDEVGLWGEEHHLCEDAEEEAEERTAIS
jgi:hypothetical protein